MYDKYTPPNTIDKIHSDGGDDKKKVKRTGTGEDKNWKEGEGKSVEYDKPTTNKEGVEYTGKVYVDKPRKAGQPSTKPLPKKEVPEKSVPRFTR